MKDKKLDELLSILETSKALKIYDKPLDDFTSFIKEIELTPGSYKLDLDILYDIYRDSKNAQIPTDNKLILKSLGFKLDIPRKNIHIIYVSKSDKERLTLEYAEKISEKIYKTNQKK
jgi:hypothetical protein